jgi:DNA (cytosine-5)-methyltransferase 1
MGYHRAGFDVIGVDINPQPNYPFQFVQADALEYLRGHGSWAATHAIHASPPCQRYSLVQLSNPDAVRESHPDFVPPIRELLKATGVPYVIENVVGAPMQYPLTLCGEMFGLGVIRHRLFESNVFLLSPPHMPHRGNTQCYRHGKMYNGPYFAIYGTGGERGSLDDWRIAMDMPWCQEKREIAEAIPPAYTEYIGAQLLESIGAAA